MFAMFTVSMAGVAPQQLLPASLQAPIAINCNSTEASANTDESSNEPALSAEEISRCNQLDVESRTPFLNMNTCSVEQLMEVPHVGHKIAQAIVTERNSHGQYTSWPNLEQRVKGLGVRKVEELQQRTFDVAPTLHGFLRDANELAGSVLRCSGLPTGLVDYLVQERPFSNLHDLKACVGSHALAHLQNTLLGPSWSPPLFPPTPTSPPAATPPTPPSPSPAPTPPTRCANPTPKQRGWPWFAWIHPLIGPSPPPASLLPADVTGHTALPGTCQTSPLHQQLPQQQQQQQQQQQGDRPGTAFAASGPDSVAIHEGNFTPSPKRQGRLRKPPLRVMSADRDAAAAEQQPVAVATGVELEGGGHASHPHGTAEPERGESGTHLQAAGKQLQPKRRGRLPKLRKQQQLQVAEGGEGLGLYLEGSGEEDQGQSAGDTALAGEESDVCEGGAVPAARWWDTCTGGSKNPPFPPEFRDPEVTKRWEYNYVHLAPDEDRPGEYLYDGNPVSAQKANQMRSQWEMLYPKTPQANTKGNGRETPAVRMKGTGTPEIRAFVWGQLRRLEAFQDIPKEWASCYRVDPYGNVVSLTAAPKDSVCGFQVDHIFPWSRGGLTVKPNVAAVHWAANEKVKRDHIINANCGDTLVERMQMGLSVDQFLSLVANREGRRRSAAKQFDHMLETLLCTPFSMPHRQLPGLEPGPQVCAFLRAAYAAAMDDFGTGSVDGGALDSIEG